MSHVSCDLSHSFFLAHSHYNDSNCYTCVFAGAVPSAAPDDVGVEVTNSSLVKVSWTRVHKDKLHGHLGGYKVIPQKTSALCFKSQFKRNDPDLTLTVSLPHPTVLPPSFGSLMFSCTGVPGSKCNNYTQHICMICKFDPCVSFLM